MPLSLKCHVRLLSLLLVLSLMGCNLYVDLAQLDDGGDSEPHRDAFVEPDADDLPGPGPGNGTQLCSEDTLQDFCARQQAQCGEVSGKDICGRDVVVACGSCTGGLICHGDNRCACPDESVSQYCARYQAECGIYEGQDACGINRRYQCGVCGDGLPCEENRCCVPEDDEALCAQVETCGSSAVVDACGIRRIVNCPGTCAQTNRTCENVNGGWCCAHPTSGC
jgi:hypothetical protein